MSDYSFKYFPGRYHHPAAQHVLPNGLFAGAQITAVGRISVVIFSQIDLNCGWNPVQDRGR